METEVKRITTLNYPAWDEFVDRSNNGTIFHKLKFLQYHPTGRFNFHNLVFYINNKLAAVLPGYINDGVFKSPMGASYGSFATEDIDFDKHEKIVDAFLAYMREQNVTKIYLTPPPVVYYKNPNQIDGFTLAYKGFKPSCQLISNVVNLTREGELFNFFEDSHQRAVRKSEKEDIQVEFNKDYENFYPILVENKKKFNVPPTHSFEELIKLSQLFPDELKLHMAYKDGNPIAGVLLFICNTNTVLAFYISHYFQYQNLRAVNRLLGDSAKWAQLNGYKWFDLGVSMDTASSNPMEPSRNLISFKEGFASRGFLRTTYSYEF
jgi:hypothetical protein